MSVELLCCPACGAQIDIEGANEIFRCKFCGNTLRIRKRNVNDDGSMTVIDKATGMVLGTVRIPFGYQVSGNVLPGISSYSYPFGVGITGRNNGSTMVSYFIGESYCDRSKCPILSSIYSQGMEQISHTHYRNFTEIRQYMDLYISQYATAIKAVKLGFIEERAMPLYEPLQKDEALENFKRKVEFEKQRSGNASMAKNLDFYLEGICRVYGMIVNEKEYRVALTTVMEAWKYQMMTPGGFSGDLGSIFGGALSGGLGGFFSNKQAQQNRQPVTGGFGTMPNNSVIEWQSDGLFLLQSAPEDFESAFSGVYRDFCSTLHIDNGVREKMYQMQTQILQNIAAHGQQQVDAMNRQFQSWQQVHATQQAAFDSYNRSWWSRTNAADAARRASYQSSLNSGNHSSDSYSEAIRGVNTYVREDGTEVELSVAYDRGFTNASGDILGTTGSTNPGTNWTEMNRK